MAISVKTVHLVLLGTGSADTEHDDLQDALDRADFLSQPEHSVAEHAYVQTVIRVEQATA